MTTVMETLGAFADTGESHRDRDAYLQTLATNFTGNTAVGAVYADAQPTGKTHHDPDAVGNYQLPQTD